MHESFPLLCFIIKIYINRRGERNRKGVARRISSKFIQNKSMVKSFKSPSNSSNGNTTFIGFGVFADAATTTTPTATTTSSSLSLNDSSSSSSSRRTAVTKQLQQDVQSSSITPIYVGTDHTFATLYTRIQQKRDTTTIIKALQDVQYHIHELGSTTSTTTSTNGSSSIQNKKVFIDAMKHYAYLYYHRLAIGTFTTTSSSSASASSSNSKTTEATTVAASPSTTKTGVTTNIVISNATIRAQALQVWYMFYQYIPKAIHTYLSTVYPTMYGMFFITQYDPSNEVRTITTTTLVSIQQSTSTSQQQQSTIPGIPPLLVHPLSLLLLTKDATDNDTSNQEKNVDQYDPQYIQYWDDGILTYITQLLSYTKPIQYLEALVSHHQQQQKVDTTSKYNSSTSSNMNKNSKNPNSSSIQLNDVQRDIMDELYIRMISNGLDALIGWIQLTQKNTITTSSMSTKKIVITWDDHVVIWFKPFISYAAVHSATAGSSKHGNNINSQSPHLIRRKSYQLLTTMIMYASYLLIDQKNMNDAELTTTLSDSSSTSILLIQKIVTLAVSNEKDPMNISYLLEMILSIMSYYKKNHLNTIVSTFIQAIYKPLVKLFQKGCYGAKVENNWGPMILPLLVVIWNNHTYSPIDVTNDCNDSDNNNNNNMQQPQQLQQVYQLLCAIQSGISITFGKNDKYHLYIALCETCNYILLLQQQQSLSMEDDDVNNNNKSEIDVEEIQKVAIIWIDGLRYFLCNSVTPIDNATTRRQRSITNSSTPVKRTTTSAAAQSPITVVTNTSDGQSRLLHDLVKHLIQFHQVTTNHTTSSNETKRYCLFVHISDWFWTDGITNVLANCATTTLNVTDSTSCYPLHSLIQLIEEIQANKNNVVTTTTTDNNQNLVLTVILTKLIPIIVGTFHTILNILQGSSSAVPSNDMYQFLQIVLVYYGPQIVFHEEESLSSLSIQESSKSITTTSLLHFIMNDLLRWSIIHTSTCVTEQRHERSIYLVQQDFLLLSMCLDGITPTLYHSNTKKDTWKSFLREIIAAKCDVKYFVSGLSTLLQQQIEQEDQIDSIQDWLPCDVLDKYALEIGHSREQPQLDLNEDEHDNDEHGIDAAKATTSMLVTDKLSFLRLCLGISSEVDCKLLLVSKDVVTSYVDEIVNSSPTAGQNVTTKLHSMSSLLIALLEAIQCNSALLRSDSINQILTSSWYCVHHTVIKSISISILKADIAVMEYFQSSALQVLRDDVRAYTSNDVTDDTILGWTKRVWFLSRLGSDSDEITSFPLLGFEIVDEWINHPYIMFRLASSLLQNIQSATDRLRLVKHWTNVEPAEYIVDLLVAMSEANSDYFKATKCRDHTDRSATFLNSIGGKTMEPNFLDRLIQAVIDKASKALLGGIIDNNTIQRQVAVLSLLLSHRFESISENCIDTIEPEKVTQGDHLWYINDPNNPENREKVQVVKVHFDATTGYYFSVKFDRDGTSIERQTVIERLRNGQYFDALHQSHNDSGDRKKVRNLIWNTLLSPHLTKVRTPSLGELVNIIVAQLGLGKERGIGSMYYDVLQYIKSLEQNIEKVMQDGHFETMTDYILSFALVLGYGLNTIGSNFIASQMWPNPIPFITRIVHYFTETCVEENTSLNKAVVTFLSSTCSIASKGELSRIENDKFLSLLFRVSAKLIKSGNDAESSILSYRALEGCSMNSHFLELSSESPFYDDFLNVLNLTIDVFANLESKDMCSDHFLSLQSFMKVCMKRPNLRESLVNASIQNSSALCRCLFHPVKRNIAFTLFELIGIRGKVLYVSEDDVRLPPETALSLSRWIDGLDDGDAAVVEEDVYIVAEWVPSSLMVEIESWDDAGFEMENKSTIVGRLLCWFCFLRFIESAAPLSFRNRPAFISYLDKCAAAYSILNLGLLHNDIINDNKNKSTPTVDEVSDILEQNSNPDITQLATLSLFRTVEVLPSLCRRWWEDDCPQVYTGAVQTLVEKFVAPEILRRELDRMKSATTFGKMSVSSSSVSREVTATYVQDDFTLKVIITLPPAFPFRSAEVDCSKTLGVPQSRWKRWSLQITLMLNSQGGTLQDALLLWKDNVDKEFEGVEPCPVCYSVLHVKTHKLPSLECKTCHNRFHLECLSEWFRSSGKSQCVLCQQPWQGTRV